LLAYLILHEVKGTLHLALCQGTFTHFIPWGKSRLSAEMALDGPARTPNLASLTWLALLHGQSLLRVRLRLRPSRGWCQ
jgi:hypothetical protein